MTAAPRRPARATRAAASLAAAFTAGLTACAPAAAPRDAPAPAAAVVVVDPRVAPKTPPSWAREGAAQDDVEEGPQEPPPPPLEGMLRLPAGYFVMGADDGQDARPIHEVAVARFDLDRTEVTVAAYRACVEAGACQVPHETRFCNALDGDRDDHPINCVDAEMAAAYCAFVDRRLPTEQEWEYAARGGEEHRRYSWGSEAPDATRACYDHPGTCPVASFPAGAFGLYDVSGNVWEWTSSFYAPYPDPATEGTHLVYRGGSWSRRYARWLMSGLRNRYRPEEWSAALGVRCARSVAPIACPDDAEVDDGRCVRTSGVSLLDAPPPAQDRRASSTTDAAAAPAAAEDLELMPIVTSRSPEFDGDCAVHWPKTPVAYRVSGGTFPMRPSSVGGQHCSRRDVGRGYSSLCCPG